MFSYMYIYIYMYLYAESMPPENWGAGWPRFAATSALLPKHFFFCNR